VYYAKVFKDDVDQAMDILSDLLLHSKLDEGAIERERSVILREAEEVSKDLEEVIFDKLHETAYMGSGLGRTILGTEQNIKSLTKADLQGYINTHYTGPRVVISAAGPVDHGELGVLAEKYFGELPGPSDASPSVLTEAPREPQPFVGSEIRVIDDAIGATHVALGFETGGWTDPHAFPLMVIQNMIGSWNRSVSTGPNLSSDIARTLASSGRAHSVSAFNTSYQDTGLMGVYYVTDPAYHVEGSEAVLGGLRDLYDATDAAAVERAKQQLKAGMLMQLDGTTAVMEDIGRSMLAYGRRMTPAEVFARVDAVTVDDVAAAARAVFYDKNYALATLGHHGEISDPEWWRDRVVNWLSR
jgi:processing peptidase subunit beta